MFTHKIDNILKYYQEIEKISPPVLLYKNVPNDGFYFYQKINQETEDFIDRIEYTDWDVKTFHNRLYIGVLSIKNIYEKFLGETINTTNNQYSYLVSFETNKKGNALIETLDVPDYLWFLWANKNNKNEQQVLDKKVNLEQKINVFFKSLTYPFMYEVNYVQKILDIIIKELNVFSIEEIKNIAYMESFLSENYEKIKKLNQKIFPSMSLPNFYLKDLMNINSKNIKGTALEQYLTNPNDIKHFNVVKDKKNMENMLSAEYMTTAAWPGKGGFPLVTAQQLAVNNFFRFYFDKEQTGIYSCNGPPGSGKTTMMADIIANVIYKRSNAILKANNKLFITTKNINIKGENYLVEVPNPNITGYEIVVASSNNTAVENITKELGLKNNSEMNVIKDFDYFSTQSNNWGTIAACLGNSMNKKSFIQSMGISEYRENSVLEKIKTEEPFNIDNEALDRYVNSVSTIMALAEKRKVVNNSKINELVEEILINENFFNEDEKVIHTTSPLNSKDFNQGKINLFLESIKIQKLAILKNKQKIINNLLLLDELFKGNIKDKSAAKAIWQTLFLVIPVISTTYASFASMFKDLDAGDLGVLISDESGQAMPHVAMGALWKTKYAMIVGDPLQIVPVVPLDETIDNALAKKHNIHEIYQITKSSVQEVADIVNPYGDTIKVNGQEKWIGSPLKVHRRCAEPMFSLANKIAYDNSMIHSYNDNKQGIFENILGKSQWFDIENSGLKKHHFNENEYEFLKFQLKRLVFSGQLSEDNFSLYIISPFKSVVDEIKRRLLKDDDWSDNFFITEKKKKNFINYNIGTVHKFQGKEAESVILVLGGSEDKKAAVDWATKDPNMPNVALTRAKKVFYVIGNSNLWNQGNFKLIQKKLSNKIED